MYANLKSEFEVQKRSFSMPKTRLKFRIVPSWLELNTFVADSATVVITAGSKNLWKVLEILKLGESGKRMILQGAPIECERRSAEKLIESGLAQPHEIRTQWENPNDILLSFLGG